MKKCVESHKENLAKAEREYEEELETQAATRAREASFDDMKRELSDEVIKKIDDYLQIAGDISTTDLHRILAIGPKLKDLWKIFGKQPFFYIILAVFIVISSVLLILPIRFENLSAIQIPAFVVSLGSWLSTGLKIAVDWHRIITSKLAQYNKHLEEARTHLRFEPNNALRTKNEELEQARQDYEESKAELASQKQRMGLVFQYRSLGDFIQDRLAERTYEKGLGPMHQIQRDIREITSDLTILEHDLHKEQKKKLFPRGPARIVLFIDDLDRCPPDKVVEMLEAVQILIKTSLFVVVMAVDVRFITRALENEYHGILTRRGDPSGLDYIEKIIQIPYRVRTIAPSAVRTYLRSQMEIEEREIESPEQLSFGEPGSEPQYRTEEPPAAAPENDLEHRLPRDVIKFTRKEFEMIEKTCGRIGLTPRAVKRLVNVYKILKIIWFRPNRYAEPDPEVKQVTIALLALAARYPDFMRDALWQLDNWVNQTQRNRRLQDCLPREEDQCSAYTKRECSQLITAASDLIPPEIRVDALSGGIVDLIRSFSFVGDIGYSPDEDEQRYAHQVSFEETAN